MIELPHGPMDNLWARLLELAAAHPNGWTLIGAQMVALHAHERGAQPPRGSTDADVLANVRAVADATTQISDWLVAQRFNLDGISSEGIGHRFTDADGKVRIDVLAPDGLAQQRARLVTVPPARTVCVPGGTQALRRTELVDITLGSVHGRLPRPDLLGAILIKARAVEIDDVPAAQLGDLAFLFTLVLDPRELATQLRGRERSWLRRRRELLDRSATCWGPLPPDDADNGHLAFRLLAGL
jgi:hypothetical protein